MPKAIYENMCPNCGGDICSDRLEIGIFCKKCMNHNEDKCHIKNLKYFKAFCDAENMFLQFSEFFESKLGTKPNSVQTMWAKRFFLDNSFALLAPTGIGKTTFGLLLAGFLKNAYIIFPTKLLVKQASERFTNWGINHLCYTGKKEEKEKIALGRYEILITTTQFLYKNRDIIKRDFSLVFVDDVDSILKSGRKIETVLSLLGFTEEDMTKAVQAARERKFDELKTIVSKRKGNLIVSSATANPRSKKIKLFTYLLNFEVSRPSLNLRNIKDLYEIPKNIREKTIYLAKILGKGGLIFLPGNETKATLRKFVEFLNKNGVKSASYDEFEEHIEEFKRGEILFVGFASYRNPLARGLDMPEHVRYTIFAGVPKMEYEINEDNYKNLYFVLIALMPLVYKKYSEDRKEILKFKKYVETLKKYAFAKNHSEKTKEKLLQIKKEIHDFIKENHEEITQSPDIFFTGNKIIIADITGYIQSSGRCSRFYKGNLTKGISILLVDNEKAFRSLTKKARLFGDIEFEKLNETILPELLKEADKSRTEAKPLNLKTTFVIVESPVKAKTISLFFGQPSMRIVNGVPLYEVITDKGVLILAASVGHDFDLSERGRYGVLEKHIPVFRIISGKEYLIKGFNEESTEVNEVVIATDPDREGEKIAFDLKLNNKPFNENIKRAEFHEITKYAFQNALENLRDINENLVASQFVRRIADRWVGFEVSAFIREKIGIRTLSAGRVQTPVLKWIADRTKLLGKKIYAVKVLFDGTEEEFTFKNKRDAEKFSNKNTVCVKKTNRKTKTISVKPFNTSSLLKEASVCLRLSPQNTMKIAQDLFETGFITYHRTDSIHVSDIGRNIAKEYIEEKFGIELFVPRAFSESEGAHECIRPTKPFDAKEIETFITERTINLTVLHIALYDLIFRRFVASQMKPAKVIETDFYIDGKKVSMLTGIIEKGLNLVYPVKITPLEEGKYTASKKLYKKPEYTPYTYADIIEMMKERGVGRPSTYAITMEKLIKRKYVVQKGQFIFATRRGFKVLETIKQSKFERYVNEGFTARLERETDLIAGGKKKYADVLSALHDALFEWTNK